MSEKIKRPLTFNERIAFVDFVTNNTIADGLEYKDLYIDYAIAELFYGYKSEEEKPLLSKVYEDCAKIKAENDDFYNYEVVDLISVIDKKLEYHYLANPANTAIERLADSLSVLFETLTDKLNDTDFNAIGARFVELAEKHSEKENGN